MEQSCKPRVYLGKVGYKSFLACLLPLEEQVPILCTEADSDARRRHHGDLHTPTPRIHSCMYPAHAEPLLNACVSARRICKGHACLARN